MNGMGDGIGAAIEGGLFGRAVEPAHGEASDAPHPPAECANCGAMVTGHYCGQCGQKAHVHRSLAAIGHDIMHGVLHLDGKLWNTLPLLAFKPGRLTRRYIEGERAKFVSPMAMFLFSVFAMFAVFQMVGLSVPTDISGSSTFDGITKNVQQQAEAERDAALAELADMPATAPERAATEQRLERADTALADLASGFATGSELDIDGQLTGIKALDEGIIKKWQQNPGLMLYKLQANGYKFSWLLIPLSIPFVWLMFAWRRQFKAYDHAVFVTYSLAFMSLLFIGISLASVAGLAGEWIGGFLVIAVPLHLYKHLRYSYGLKRVSALWRFSVLVIFIMIVLVLFLQALLVLGMY